MNFRDRIYFQNLTQTLSYTETAKVVKFLATFWET